MIHFTLLPFALMAYSCAPVIITILWAMSLTLTKGLRK